MPKDIMIDIETLSTAPNAVAVTIGVCAFNTDAGEIGEKLLIHVDPKSAQKHGLHLDAGTMLWWMKQSKAAQAALSHPNALTLPLALKRLFDFVVGIREQNPSAKLQVWGNDPSFDCTILESAFKAVDRVPPWNFHEERSCRTIKMLGERIGFDLKRDLPREGTGGHSVHHDAMDDAVYQAQWVMAIVRLLDPDLGQ